MVSVNFHRMNEKSEVEIMVFKNFASLNIDFKADNVNNSVNFHFKNEEEAQVFLKNIGKAKTKKYDN